MSNADQYLERSLDVLKGLKEAKGLMKEDLKDIQIEVSRDDSPIITKAIDEVFGIMEDGDPRKGFITFDMYMECQRIIMAAGEAKAESELQKGFG